MRSHSISSSDLRQRKLKRYQFIDKEKKNYPFQLLCRVMQVSPSGYYAWRKRLTKPPSVRRKSLKQLVRSCYFENRRRYGSRRIAKSLSRSGTRIGRRKVSGLMKEEGLKAIQYKTFKPKTTDSKGTTAAPHLLTNIELKECAPTKIIIGDITYIRLRGGKFCYLAIWQDKVTRRIIGWSLALEMTQELVISALQKAIRKGLIKAGAIIHSDRCSQYASNGISPTFATERISAKYERARQLLRQRASREFLFAL